MGSGRHHVEQGSRGVGGYVIGGIVLVAVLLAGYLFVDMARGSGGCSSTGQASVAVSPDLAPTVAELVDSTSTSDLGCVEFEVLARDSSAATQGLVGGAEVPDLWIPDSMTWVRKANKVLPEPVALAAESVAFSPAVVVAGAGDLPEPASWGEVMRTPGIRLGNPMSSAAAAAPVLAAVAEAEASNTDPQEVAAALVPVAQAQSQQLSDDALTSADGAPAVADSVRANGGKGVVTEQVAVSMGPEFDAAVPATGTVFMAYPLVISASVERRGEATVASGRLLELLSSERGAAALSTAGFRTSAEEPLGGDRGVGVVSELKIGNAATAERALARWSALAVPTRALVAIDVSGSMAAPAEGGTRMGLTQQAALVGIGLFPDNAQLGLWAFSVDLGGPQVDFKELAPTAKLGPIGGGSHRDRLGSAVYSLDTMVKGGTGLYDTVFAAYKTALDGYDPNAVNAVIVLTDGENEDPSSITRTQLMEGLARMADPARPVVVVGIGITDDADEEVLAEMAKVTGGSSFIARDPADIPTVFAKALSQRQG